MQKLVDNSKKSIQYNYFICTIDDSLEIKPFDFFIDLRSNPSKYIEESKQYELDDIIIYANNNKLFEYLYYLSVYFQTLRPMF